jgi:hypothetical protein
MMDGLFCVFVFFVIIIFRWRVIGERSKENNVMSRAPFRGICFAVCAGMAVGRLRLYLFDGN